MKNNKPYLYPPLARRIFGVWFRHTRVYTKNIFSNGLPPFLEPLIFLAGVGLGLGKYITQSMEGLTYIEFLGTGLLMTAAMFTASFECTFGTFIRMEFEKVYDGMLAAPIDRQQPDYRGNYLGGDKGIFLLVCRAVRADLFRHHIFASGFACAVYRVFHRADVFCYGVIGYVICQDD